MAGDLGPAADSRVWFYWQGVVLYVHPGPDHPHKQWSPLELSLLRDIGAQGTRGILGN